MSREQALARLAELQRRFGDALRTPLDRRSGTLRADVAAFDAGACAAVVGGAGRLAIYNRQYWFRLFTTFHHEYRLATALLGAWEMNALVGGFLAHQPPSTRDLRQAADGFDAFLSNAGLSTEILQAVAIDAAFRRVAAAGEEPHFRPGPADAERLQLVPLRAAARCQLVDEDHAFLELHRRLGEVAGEPCLPLPARHAGGRQHHLIHADPAGIQVVRLAPLQARLYRLLARHALPEALAHLEEPCAPADARRWLAESVRLGLWSGFAEGEPCAT